MAYRILTAAALAVALAAPAMADQEGDLRVIMHAVSPACSKPINQLTVQEFTVCKDAAESLRTFSNEIERARLATEKKGNAR